MKNKKISILLIFTILVYIMLSFNTIAASNLDTDLNDELTELVKAKNDLRDAHSSEFKANFADTVEGQKRDVKIKDSLKKLAAGETDTETITEELAKIGFYILEMENVAKENIAIELMRAPQDVTINNVTLGYDSYNNRWEIACGGWWVNNNWNNDFGHSVFHQIGETINVGGYDGIGIKFYNTYGTYNTRMISSWGYVSTGTGKSIDLYSPSIFDGTKGIYFQFQDYAIVESINSNLPYDRTYSYMGKHFSLGVTFDGNFENFHGYARMQYDHTWDTCQFTNVTFGINTFNVTVSVTSKWFQLFSNGEKTF